MKKRFFSKHTKSSAALVSLGIHAVLIVVALSFVAVTVITKEDQVFEAKPVNRPKMQLKKLQVPVNIKKKKVQKPRLRKRIVVQPKLAKVPDIKMPEITGVKGGMGSAAGTGLGGAGSLGFNMPEMNLFGVKSRGEKVYIILDASDDMMVDEMGGIPAYTIIKSELVRILEGLNPAVLFNIAIYEEAQSFQLFPSLVSANAAHVAQVEAWLEPLNAVTKNMGNKDYGTKTKGPGGSSIDANFNVEPLQNTPGEWAQPALLAMEQQADVIFLLSCNWGIVRYKTGSRDRNWSESNQKRYEESVAKAKALLKKENDRRRAKGQSPRVITRGNRGLVKAYFPGTQLPPAIREWHNYTPEEMAEAFSNLQAQSKYNIPLKSGLGRKKAKKNRFTFNVIHFVPDGSGSKKDSKFKKIADLTRGEYNSVEGMGAIQSYVSASEGGL
jgi:hypothetical protein